MATLYLVTKSGFMHTDPYEAIEVAILQREIEEKIGIVLLQDAVLGARKGQSSANGEIFEKLLLEAEEKGVKMYVLEPDLSARAMKPENIVEGMVLIDYHKLVDLIMDEYETVVSWT